MALPYYDTYRGVDICRAKNDTYGHPRYVVHFLAFPNLDPGKWETETHAAYFQRHIGLVARAIGGTRYRGSDFGGGVVFQSYYPEANIDRALAATLDTNGEVIR